MFAAPARRPGGVSATIAACAGLALALRAYQLSRPGYLLGVTEYDDGVLFGNALRLVSGVIPYRDFAMVQPPGSALLMAPVALLAKLTGTAWGLNSDVAGCPAMTDSFGTLIAMTSGHPRDASSAVLAPAVALWQATLARARYVWLTFDTVAQIPWTRQLYGYFSGHFRLIGLAGQPVPWRDVPRPGLYLRT